MAQFLGFGDGSDGDLVITGTVTEVPVDSSCSGNSGEDTLVATNASFASGDYILIHQSRGTDAGVWELNQILSYTAGEITLVIPLTHTYTDSGASQAQVRVVPQYRSITIESGGFWQPKAWDGDVGGILCFMCSGKISGAGKFRLDERGYRGGEAATLGQDGMQGEGTAGAGTNSIAANGNGGGGGRDHVGNGTDAAGGGGGAYAAAGSGGENGPSDAAGSGGDAVGIADLTTIVFGGGGGSGGNQNNSTNGWQTGGVGGDGGGICIGFAATIGSLGGGSSDGGDGAAAIGGANDGAGGSGGGGGGGAFLFKGKTIDIDTNLFTCSAGVGNTAVRNGGNGAVGRIRVEACDLNGSTNDPSASTSEGGFSYCTSGGQIF